MSILPISFNFIGHYKVYYYERSSHITMDLEADNLEDAKKEGYIEQIMHTTSDFSYHKLRELSLEEVMVIASEHNDNGNSIYNFRGVSLKASLPVCVKCKTIIAKTTDGNCPHCNSLVITLKQDQFFEYSN